MRNPNWQGTCSHGLPQERIPETAQLGGSDAAAAIKEGQKTVLLEIRADADTLRRGDLRNARQRQDHQVVGMTK